MKLYVLSSQIFIFESILVTTDRNDGHKGKTNKQTKIRKRDLPKDEGENR